MSINLNTKPHCEYGIYGWWMKQPQLLNINRLKHDELKMLKQYTNGRWDTNFVFRIMIRAALYSGANQAELFDLFCYLAGKKMYTGKLTTFVQQEFGVDLNAFCTVRRNQLRRWEEGAPIFRKKFVIDLGQYMDALTNNIITSNLINHLLYESMNKLREIVTTYEDNRDTEEHPEHYLMPDDDWYPWDTKKSAPEKEPDFNRVPENDNEHFITLDKKSGEVEVVQILPNTQKLVALRRSDGNVHYIVIGEDIDVARLPKIYSMFLRDELNMGCNITTDRLTRIIKLQELQEVGFNPTEIAEYLDVPRHIVYSDTRVLKNIEILQQKQ